MSPLNSTNSKSFTLQQVKTMLQSQFKNVQFSFLLFSIYVLSIKKNVRCFFLSFFYVLCSTMFKFLFFFFLSHFHCPAAFFFLVFFFLFSFFCFFLIINCSFNVPCFSNLISTSLCPYINTITIGSLPSLFNFDL